jgi:hypothetical protein
MQARNCEEQSQGTWPAIYRKREEAEVEETVDGVLNSHYDGGGFGAINALDGVAVTRGELGRGENNGEEETVTVISINRRKRTDDGARGRAWLPRAGGCRRRGGWGLLAQGLARLARLGQGARTARRAGSRGAAARRSGAGVRAQERAERGERSGEGERVGEREERRESEQGGSGGWEKSQGARAWCLVLGFGDRAPSVSAGVGFRFFSFFF